MMATIMFDWMRLFKYIVLIFSIIFILIDAINWPLMEFSFILIGIILFLLYDMFKHGTGDTDEHFWFESLQNSRWVVLKLLFVLVFVISLISIRISYTHRPIFYFVCIGVLVCITAFEILFVKNSKKEFLILQIIAIAVSIRLSALILFMQPLGYDGWFHVTDMHRLIESGMGNIQYKEWPIFSIITSTFSLLTKISNPGIIFAAIGFIEAVSVALIYYTTKLFTDEKTALLASLLLAVGGQHILYGSNVLPQTVGLIYITGILYFMFSGYKPRNLVALFLTMFALILSHSIISFVFMISVVIIFASQFAYNILFKDRSLLISLGVVLVFGIGLISHWMYISVWMFRGAVQSTLNRIFFSEPVYTALATANSNAKVFFDALGIDILMLLFILGLIYLINNRFENKIFFGVASISTFFFVICLGYTYFLDSIDVQIPRFWSALMILAAPVAALGIKNIKQAFNQKHLFSCSIVLPVIFALSFLMITSTASNNIDPYLAQDSCYVEPFTKIQEFDSVDFLVQKSDSLSVYSDTHYAKEQLSISNKTSYMLADIMEQNVTSGSLMFATEKTDYNAFRMVLKHGYGAVKTTTSCVKFDEKNSNVLSQKYDRVYDNGHAFMFYT